MKLFLDTNIVLDLLERTVSKRGNDLVSTSIKWGS